MNTGTLETYVSAPRYLFLMTTKGCPNCFSDTGIRTILYGLHLQEPDPAIYTIGACGIWDNMPDFECLECHWKGSKAEVRQTSRAKRFIWTDADGLTINPPSPNPYVFLPLHL